MHQPLFLDNTQTLFGTLLTLVVLCVVFNDSNFIHSILKNIIDQIHKEIKELTIYIDTSDVKSNKDYAILRLFRNGRDEEDQVDEDKQKLLSDCYNWTLKLDNNNFKSISEKAEQKQKEKDAVIDKIKECNEPNLAAIYCFFYALLVMLVDGIVPFFADASWFFINALYLFTAFSVIFWLFLWVRYFYPNKSWPLRQRFKKEGNKGRILIDRFNGLRTRYRILWMSVSYLIIVAIVSLIAYYINGMSIDHIWNCIFYTTVAFSMIVAIIWTFHRCNSGEYQYSMPLLHYMIFLGLSLLLTAIGYCIYGTAPLPLIAGTPQYVLGIVTILFITFNGLIAPFLFPYMRYNKVYSDARRAVNDHQKELNALKSNIIKELESLSERIKERLND